ncbi:MAG: 23S rRNA (adenine(2503)-C(2))-methyltransferase RlmN [Ruminococcaceae bacterium]|nr:23S rRNA (adenine(2503)-C(2))-methyltransferase RlmN [Oscillospiraceae bacterium]
MDKIDIKSFDLKELTEKFIEDGIQKYRAKQVFDWLNKGISSFDEMQNIPKDLKAALNEKYFIPSCSIEIKRVSKLDGTIKYLYKLYDGEYIEAVIMKYHHGISICISSQVGCKMGCTFCATGKGGFKRNLYPSEMLSEIETAEKDIGERISNIVLMGMGEPLDNFDNVMKFLKLVSSEEGMNKGMRHISLSTCGIVDKIYKLADMKLQLTLSVSLHAPNNTIRNHTMPVNKKWNVEELLEACKYYGKVTGRRISFEYAVISGINDSDECAHELGRKLKPVLCHVNLIPVNDVTDTGYKKSSQKRHQAIINILSNYGITATIRRTLGADIEAACGQLKGKHIST